MAEEKKRLARIADKKLHACTVYLAATQQLVDALSAEDMAAVAHHIRRRGEMIRVMDHLDRQAGRYGGRGLPDPAGEIRKVLRKIVEIDEACGAAARNRYNHLKKAMTAVKGYAQKRESLPKLFSIQM
jgi:hypothetical protein